VSNKAGELPYYLYAYDSYGTTTEGGGSYEGQLASYKGYDSGPFGYKTGVRHYDPETGRFLSPDPFKGYITDPASQHPYMYCRGNPINYADPSGYDSVFIGTYQYPKDTITNKAKFYSDLVKRYGVKNVSVKYNPKLSEITDALKKHEIIIILGHGDQKGTKFGGNKSDSHLINKGDLLKYLQNNSKTTKTHLLYLSFCFSSKWNELPIEFIVGFEGETNVNTKGQVIPGKDLSDLRTFFQNVKKSKKGTLFRGAGDVYGNNKNMRFFRNGKQILP